jgi:arylsulfatase A-like enzyme
LPVDHDPDQVLGACQAYAGQVTLLDKCLGGLIDVLDGLPDSRRTLLVLTGARGFPLGEHHRLGPCDEWLGAELVHVPLLLRFGDGSGALGRNACFVQPADLGETVLDWFEIAIRSPAAGAGNLLSNVRGDSVSLRDRAVVALADRHAIRTSAWYSQSLVGQTESHDSAQTTWLYAKPDDRWEQNDVADRCPDVVQALATAYNSFAEHALAGSLNELPPMETNLKLEW